jgi:hypothetical protein
MPVPAASQSVRTARRFVQQVRIPSARRARAAAAEDVATLAFETASTQAIPCAHSRGPTVYPVAEPVHFRPARGRVLRESPFKV